MPRREGRPVEQVPRVGGSGSRREVLDRLGQPNRSAERRCDDEHGPPRPGSPPPDQPDDARYGDRPNSAAHGRDCFGDAVEPAGAMRGEPIGDRPVQRCNSFGADRSFEGFGQRPAHQPDDRTCAAGDGQERVPVACGRSNVQLPIAPNDPTVGSVASRSAAGRPPRPGCGEPPPNGPQARPPPPRQPPAQSSGWPGQALARRSGSCSPRGIRR